MRTSQSLLHSVLIPFWHSFTPLQAASAVLVAIVLMALAGLQLAEWLKGPETARFTGGVRVVKAARLAALTAYRDKARRPVQLFMGQVPWPEALEDKHALIVGTTGVGKSTLFRQLLRGLRARGQRAIVLDLNGEFAAAFHGKGDIIFNPRSPAGAKWNPLAEVRTSDDIHLVLKAAIPRGSTPEEENWRAYARQFMHAVMVRLQEAGQLCLGRLRYYVLDAGDKELAAFLQTGERPFRIQANSMASTVKSIAQSCVQALSEAPDDASFSVRRWVRRGDGFIFITPRDHDRAALLTLINSFINLAIAEALSAPPGKHYRPIALLVDELASFDLDDLEGALEKGRKFGLVAFAGIQNIAQLRKKYTADGAATLMACFRTKVVFNPGDAETAKRMSEEIGRQTIERREISHSQGPHGSTTSESWRREEGYAVPPEDLLGLPDLTAYLRLSGDFPVARIVIPRA